MSWNCLISSLTVYKIRISLIAICVNGHHHQSLEWCLAYNRFSKNYHMVEWKGIFDKKNTLIKWYINLSIVSEKRTDMTIKSGMISSTAWEETNLIVIKGWNYWRTKMRHINWEKKNYIHNFVTVFTMY